MCLTLMLQQRAQKAREEHRGLPLGIQVEARSGEWLATGNNQSAIDVSSLKDEEANRLDTYAGAAQRASQRARCSVAGLWK